jgi:hypothetical protein
LGKGLNNNILSGQLPMLSCHQMKTNQWPKPLKNSSDPIIGNYDVLAYKKDESGKITGYVVDLSTTLMLTFKLSH